jgi:hypothetical protein
LICVTGFGAGDSRGHGGFFYNARFHLLLGRSGAAGTRKRLAEHSTARPARRSHHHSTRQMGD